MTTTSTIDYYKELKLDPSADAEDIRRAYRHLALKYHPEKNPAPEARHQFGSIAESYHVLSDNKKRAIYDQYGYDGLKKGVTPRDDFEGYEGGYQFHGNAEQVFVQFFGGKNPFADFFGTHGTGDKKQLFGKKFGGLQGMNTSNALNSSPTQNASHIHELPVTLEELYNGSLKKIQVSRKILDQNQLTTTQVDKILTIEIGKGWKNGTKAIFSGEGDQGPNKIPGDIIFIISELKHKQFDRNKDDLIYTANIPLVDALTGTVLDILTLDGRILKIPVNEPISPNSIKKIPGEGMPLSKDPSKHGDLIIKFATSYPAYLTNEQKALLRKAFN